MPRRSWALTTPLRVGPGDRLHLGEQVRELLGVPSVAAAAPGNRTELGDGGSLDRAGGQDLVDDGTDLTGDVGGVDAHPGRRHRPLDLAAR